MLSNFKPSAVMHNFTLFSTPHIVYLHKQDPIAIPHYPLCLFYVFICLPVRLCEDMSTVSLVCDLYRAVKSLVNMFAVLSPVFCRFDSLSHFIFQHLNKIDPLISIDFYEILWQTYSENTR